MVAYLFEAPLAHESESVFEGELESKRPYNARFMQSMAQRILGTPKHPLRFLVNPGTGWWWATSPWAKAAQHHPAVQAGHGDSSWAVRGGAKGMRERLYIEDAGFNQTVANTLERKGGIVGHTGVLIGGVPVELATARMWANLGLLPPSVLAKAPPSQGWTPP